MKDGSWVTRRPVKMGKQRGLCTRVAVVSSPLGREAIAHVRWPGDRRAYGLPARLVEVVR